MWNFGETSFLTKTQDYVIGGGCSGNQQHFYRTTNGGKKWVGYYQNMWNSGMSDLFIDKKTGVGYA